MADRARTQFLSVVVLVVVFAAGGLVGAAVGRQPAVADGPSDGPVNLATQDDEAGDAGERDSGDREQRRYQTMYERAGATEEQSERIRSEILPWYSAARDSLWNDPAVQALDVLEDSLRSEHRAARRELLDYYEPREQALTDSARALIRAVLDPPAQLAYDSLVAERNRRERDDGNRRHP